MQGGDIKVESVKPVFAVNDDIFELKFSHGNEKYTQIGSLCRFAAFITAVARTFLFRGLVVVQDLLSK